MKSSYGHGTVKPIDFPIRTRYYGFRHLYQVPHPERACFINKQTYSAVKEKLWQLEKNSSKKSNLGECAEHADVVLQGEAEYTWPSFISDFQSGNAQPLYVQDGFVDLALLLRPALKLLGFRHIQQQSLKHRGCPHSCEFCEIPIRLGKRPRNKSVEQVMAEYLVSTHWAQILSSSLMTTSSVIVKRALDLLAEIERFVKSIDYRVYFSCQFTIDIARDEEILILMNKANFRRVFVGIGLHGNSSLTMAGKNQNTKIDLLDAVPAHPVGFFIIVWGSFIVGFDSDDTNIFNEQLSFIQAASIPVAMVGILQAIPGTPLYGARPSKRAD